uniref:hypothetical protein n=1 Tax=Mucilaginibacter sp. TaxID=1882438 RepID=UPI00374DF979
YVDSLHNAAGTGGTTVDTTSLSNRINKNTTNIATNATDITTKLNITDTANIRLRPIAGTNTTIIGTYPNLIFNSSGIDTAKNYTWTGQHIFSNLNFTIGGTSSIGTNFRIYGPGAPADGNWSALWNQGYAPSINFGSYSYFVDLKYGAGNNIRLNRSSNYYGSRSGVQIGKGDDTLRGIIDIAAGSSRMPPISINIPTALTDSARKGSIEVVGDSLFYTGNTSIRKKVLRTGDDQRKSISVSVNYAVTSEIRVVNATSSVAITIQSPSLYLDQEITIINSSSGNVFVASANNSSIGNFNVSNIYTIPSDGSVTFHSNGTKYLISAH